VKPSESVYLEIRGLRYHCRTWGPPQAPLMVLLHGWMDVGASFQFLVDSFQHEWRVVAPDWRGFGESARTASDSYWFPDYHADLERILAHFSPHQPVNLVGHSMGGNVACIYAGVRPERIRRLVNLEGFGMAPTQPEDAPKRYARWLDELAEGASLRDYPSYQALAERLRKTNPRLTEDRAAFLARHWGGPGAEGRVVLRGDPAHKIVNPMLYQIDEAQACWRRITAPVLWVTGLETQSVGFMKLSAADLQARKACFANLTEQVVEGAGHMMHHDQPEALAALLEAFLLAP
jgi:pimeloyl-ACP methyl ester carboxylesterase